MGPGSCLAVGGTASGSPSVRGANRPCSSRGRSLRGSGAGGSPVGGGDDGSLGSGAGAGVGSVVSPLRISFNSISLPSVAPVTPAAGWSSAPVGGGGPQRKRAPRLERPLANCLLPAPHWAAAGGNPRLKPHHHERPHASHDYRRDPRPARPRLSLPQPPPGGR